MEIKKSCRHLQPLERFLRAEGQKVESTLRHWNEKRGFGGYSLYFHGIVERRQLEKRGLISIQLEYKEYGVGGQYAGFFCRGCASSISGLHPNWRKNMRKTAHKTEGPFM